MEIVVLDKFQNESELSNVRGPLKRLRLVDQQPRCAIIARAFSRSLERYVDRPTLECNNEQCGSAERSFGTGIALDVSAIIEQH